MTQYGDNEGDKKKKPPRISSTFTWATYEHIVNIGRHIDFSHPRFEGRYKRNNSWGSTVSMITEVALSSEEMRRYLTQFMVHGGAHYIPLQNYNSIKYDETGFGIFLK